MPSIIEGIAEYVQQQPDQPLVREQLEKALEPFLNFFGMVGLLVLRTQNLPPSPGYEPLLVKESINPIAARGIAHLAVRHGKRVAHDSQWMKPAADAIRFFTKIRRHSDSVLAKAKLILYISDNTSVIETIFESAGLEEFEFLRLLNEVVDGNNRGIQRVAEIATSVAQTISIRRGPKISAASAAHQFIMEGTKDRVALRAYTYDYLKSDYTDPFTLATRAEFGAPHFDPKPARRRLTASKRAKTRD